MKQTLLIPALLLVLVGGLLSSCRQDPYLDDDQLVVGPVAMNEVPVSILTYVVDNFPEATIDSVEVIRNAEGDLLYAVDLSIPIMLRFDELGTYLSTEEEADDDDD